MGKTKKKLKADVVVKNYWRNNEQFADFFQSFWNSFEQKW